MRGGFGIVRAMDGVELTEDEINGLLSGATTAEPGGTRRTATRG
jgi:hypothetical protein